MLAKGRRPKIPIAILVPVAFAPDWLDLLSHIVHRPNAMLSHSVVSVGIGSTLAALAYALWRGFGVDAGVVGLTYASHWLADYLTGLKPTWPGGPSVGLMLYSRPALDLLMESVLVFVCWIAYRRSLPAERQRSAAAYLVPIGLVAMQVAFVTLQNPTLSEGEKATASAKLVSFSLGASSFVPRWPLPTEAGRGRGGTRHLGTKPTAGGSAATR